MKKISLKLLSSALSLATVLTAVPVRDFNGAFAKAANPPKKGMSTGTKVALGVIGSGIPLAAGAVLLLAWLAPKNSPNSSGSKSTPTSACNAGSGSGHNVSTGTGSHTGGKKEPLTDEGKIELEKKKFWYVVMRKLHDSEPFRKFINDSSFKASSSKSAEEITKFREFFAEMDKSGKISAERCYDFAHEILSEMATARAEGTPFARSIIIDNKDINAILKSLDLSIHTEYQKFIDASTSQNPVSVQSAAPQATTPTDSASSPAKNFSSVSQDVSEGFSGLNANLTNTENLCFFHAWLQQMYSLKSFRNFIDNVNLNTVQNAEIREKIKAIRGFFKEMDKGGIISRECCEEFAAKILNGVDSNGHAILSNEQDIHEILSNFIPDVYGEYKKFYGSELVCVVDEPIKLESLGAGISLADLLKGEASLESKQDAIQQLFFDDGKKQQMLLAYAKKFSNEETASAEFKDEKWVFKGTIDRKNSPEIWRLRQFIVENDQNVLGEFISYFVNDLSDVTCVKDALSGLEKTQININPVKGQFVLFVSRINGKQEKDTSRVNFGDGTLNYKGKKYELTAVSVQQGSADGGHYYTYKKVGNDWYIFNDISGGAANQVTWAEVKSDAETNCTMLTFSEKTN